MLFPTLELRPGAEPYPGYRLERLLGRGGVGQVWHAQTETGRGVALKFLHSNSPQAAVQEVRALQAIRQLRHSNLLRIDNVFSSEGWLVVIMELADGGLNDLLDVYGTEINTPIPPDDLCFFLSQAAAGIDFLNTRQHLLDDQRVAFRHCDVKPSNLLLVGTTVKLSDFSLAVATTLPMARHRRAGSLHYAAPEVFQGWLSERTDLYSLAATYYQLRTGHVPFHDTPRTFNEDYVRPQCPDLSMFTDEERPILARAFAPIPQDRWSSCTEMMQRLSRCFGPKSSAGAKVATGAA